MRDRSIEPTLERLAAIQPATGGFIEAVPLTSFVVMSLAAAGRAEHEVARRGVEFLRGAAREDGSWPVDSNLSMWVTTQAVAALGAESLSGGVVHACVATMDAESHGHASREPCHPPSGEGFKETVAWILAGQHRADHVYTGAAPGGWAWTHLAGGVPDADDTAGALLALATVWDIRTVGQADRGTGNGENWTEAARAGVRWLLGLQNDDGGWPAFCRGWGKLPFDRSAADLTAHAARALAAWGPRIGGREIPLAVERALGYLTKVQEPDGSWLPLWFGNQAAPGQRNPVIGTGRVLAAYRDLIHTDDPAAERGVGYLLAAQNGDGGWGGAKGISSTMEETAIAVEGLSGWLERAEVEKACLRGSLWLVEQAAGGAIDRPSPLGLYFTTLWYGERLYPLIWTVAALGRMVERGGS